MAGNEMLMNPDGLVVNAYRDAPGRGDYFNGSSGTSEGQFLFILGALDAYKATGNKKALAMAERALSAVLFTLYRNTPIPAQVTERNIFAPHWLFSVKYPFKSSIINYDAEVYFTNGVGVIPLDTVRYVWNARTLNAVYLWQNPYSPLISGTLYPVASYAYVPGTGMRIVLASPYTGALKVTHSTQTGAEIEVGEPYEAWPDWRKLDSTEIEAACDVFIWAYRAFARAYEVTGVQTWADAARATLEQAAIAIDLNDGRDWLKQTWADSPFAEGARFSYVDRSPAPGFGVDGYGRTQIDIPQKLTGTGAVQYGKAALGDTYANDDATTVMIESSRAVTAYLFIDLFQAYSPANRYTATLNLTGAGPQTITLHRTDFKNSAGATLPAGSPVYTVAVLSDAAYPHTIWIERIRQTPPRNIAYYPGAIPFTANFAGNPPMLIDWRGPVYAGYQAPQIWTLTGGQAGAITCAQLLVDAQNAWVAQTGDQRGPFAPVFYFDRDDAVQYGVPNTFGWEGPDPNTKWGGYQYRPLAELGESLWEASPGTSLYNLCLQGATDFLKFLSTDRNWVPLKPATANSWAVAIRGASLLSYDTPAQASAAVATIHLHQDGPPTDYPQTGAELNYNEPHMTALILRAFLYRELKLRPNGGTWEVWERDLFDKCYNLFRVMYVESGVMEGTFSNDPVNHEWYGFWHGEILTTLSQLLAWAQRSGTNYANIQADCRKWLNGMLDWAEANSPTALSPWGEDFWPFAPDWAGGVSEAFEFSTNIITSFDGHEQRIARRPGYRRSLTMRHTLLNGDDSASYQAVLRSRQNRPMLVPQWHRAATLETLAPSGQGWVDLAETPDDTWKVGSPVILSAGASRQLNYVARIKGNRVYLRNGLQFNLGHTGRVVPAWHGLLNSDLSSTKPTTAYLRAEVSFLMLPQEDGYQLPDRPEDQWMLHLIEMADLWTKYIRLDTLLTPEPWPLYWPAKTVLDLPIQLFELGTEKREVVTRKPNWISEVSLADRWVYDLIDYTSGPVTPMEGHNVGARTMQARWSLFTREDHIDFLSLLKRLKGMQLACWLPSWSRDFEITRDSTAKNILYVGSNGIIEEGLLDNAAVGICVMMDNGGFYCAKVTSYTTGNTESVLTLDRNFDQIVKKNRVLRVCLLYRVRQASDKAEVTWLTTQHAEVQISFVTVQE